MMRGREGREQAEGKVKKKERRREFTGENKNRKWGEVVRREYRRYRLEVAKENGKTSTAGQITETERGKERGHQKGGKK